MCTVTIIALAPGARTPDGRHGRNTHVRLMCNRDELRARPAALPPVIRRFGERTAILPIDPVSNGTWIGVNDAGVAATLLNVNPGNSEAARRGAARSRGLLVPKMLACSSAAGALREAESIDPSAYPPFRLVLTDGLTVIDAYSDGRELMNDHKELGNLSLLFTSSGLGDALVESPRRRLFEELFPGAADAGAADPAGVQIKFHRHSWPDRRHLSVCMERDDARTVSCTIVDLEPTRVTLAYAPDSPDRTNPLEPIVLPRQGARA